MGEFFAALGDIFTSPTMYGSAVRLGGFLAFAALGELVAEKAGTINISVEGSLLAGAFTGTVAYDLTESTWMVRPMGGSRPKSRVAASAPRTATLAPLATSVSWRKRPSATSKFRMCRESAVTP